MLAGRLSQLLDTGRGWAFLLGLVGAAATAVSVGMALEDFLERCPGRRKGRSVE